jgi:hypothetical protein
MKNKAILTFSICIIATNYCWAQQTNDLKSILKQTFDAFDSSKDVSQKTALGNKLSLIAMKWPKEWIAHYYLGYSKAILSSEEKEDAKRDAYLDEAVKEHDIAVNILGKENDETYILSALIANWRIAISPMMRSGQYAKIFRENLAKAKELNAENPRIYYLQGMVKYSMPKFVGGGKEVALPFLEKADSLYAKENNLDISKPYWGKRSNSDALDICKRDKNN